MKRIYVNEDDKITYAVSCKHCENPILVISAFSRKYRRKTLGGVKNGN